MRVNEIFESIQGEGNFIGVPAVFIRLSGCNLSCPGCDSKYHREGNEKSIDEVISEIKKYETKSIVITGGEPLLQTEEVANLINKLDEGVNRYFKENREHFWFQIETNGTQDPTKLLSLIHNKAFIQFSVSPKLSQFNEEGSKKELFLRWKFIEANFILKFVVSNEKDIKEIKKIQEKMKASNEDIYLMAEGATKKEQEEKMLKIIQIAINNKYNFTPRAHILIWDSKRGV